MRLRVVRRRTQHILQHAGIFKQRFRFLDERAVPPARLWAWPAHVVDFGSVQIPTAACHGRSHRLNDLANKADRGCICSSRRRGRYPHERPIPCATGSNARQAVYLRLAKPSLRVSRSRSAAFCDAWVETTFQPLKATSTTIHVSIGTFFNVIVYPSYSWAKLMHLGRRFVSICRTEPSASTARARPDAPNSRRGLQSVTSRNSC